MAKYDFLIIGHVTSDIQEYRGVRSNFTGGAAFFSPIAAARSGAKVCVLTKMAEKDCGALAALRREGIEVMALPSAHTTSIENVYENDDVDRRIVRLLAQADPFAVQDIPPVDAEIYDLAGLFVGEIPDEMIPALAKRGKVALDMQAVLRHSDGKGFTFEDWPAKGKYLPMITFLKADSQESAVTTGITDREKAARMLYDLGAKEVMITHATEVIIYDGTRVYRAPFNPSNLTGRSGRGDTCFVSYMTRRLDHGIEESVRYAAALTSIKMEKSGPFAGTVEDVLARMKTMGIAGSGPSGPTVTGLGI